MIIQVDTGRDFDAETHNLALHQILHSEIVGGNESSNIPTGAPVEPPGKSAGYPLSERVAAMKNRIRLLLQQVMRFSEVQVHAGTS